MKIKLFSLLFGMSFFAFLHCNLIPGSITPSNSESCGNSGTGTFSVYSPMGGNSYKMGIRDTVRWTNIAATSPSYVSIQLFNDAKLVSTLVSSVYNTGMYPYYIPSVGSGTKYRIRIRSTADTMLYDFGCYFSITSIYSGSYSITSPAKAAACTSGTTYQISWQSSGSPGSYASIQLCNDSIPISYITSSVSASTGTYLWSIPMSVGSGVAYRIKMSSTSDPSIYSYSAPFSIAGLPSDSYEPDSKRTQASTLTFGKPQSHTLTYNDTDWVQFAADSGVFYIMQSYGTLSTSVYLFPDTQTSYTKYFIGSTSQTSSSSQWQCLKKGTYYARISSYSSSSTLSGGSYAFNILLYDSLAMITCSSPTTTSTWATGSAYKIQWVPDSAILGTSVYLQLYKGSSLLQSIGSVSNSGSYSWTVPTPLGTGSDYRIKIYSYSNSLLGGFSSPFSISGLTPDNFEPDNKRMLAATVSFGKSQAHNLPLGDTDWVKFTVDSGALYMLQCYGTMSTTISLFYDTDISYTKLFSGSTSASASTTQWICPKKGVYFAQIIPYSSGVSYAGGSYTFNIASYDSVNMATFSNPMSTATWNSGSSYKILWTPDSMILGSAVSISIYKGSRLIQSIANGVANSGTYSWTVLASLASGSDYRIRIANYSNAILSGFSPAFTISGITPDEYEVDDTSSKASVLLTDGTVQNHTLPGGDVDWMTFSAQKDSLYVFTATSDPTLSTYLYLYSDPTLPELINQYGSSIKLIWTCPKTGTYFLKAFASSMSQYGNLKITAKKYSLSSIVLFVNPTAVSTMSAGSSYTLQWLADTTLFGSSVSLQLYKDTTLCLSISTSVPNNGSYAWIPPAGIATGSKYSLKITSYSNTLIAGKSASFTISGLDPDKYEPDDSLGAAHIIETSGAAESHSLPLNDVDWYSFKASANNVYIVKTLGATKSMPTLLSLYGTDRKSLGLTAASTTTDSTASVVMFCAVGGNYYFKATSTLTGNYQVTVTGFDSTKYALSIFSPKALDEITVGQVDTIQWSSLVDFGGYVDIFLYNNTGVVQTIAANVANSKSYAWTIPATTTAGNSYYIKVASKVNSNIYGVSGVFSIK